MEFRILGPLEVVEGAHALQIASGHQRTLLALLLVNANRALTTDQIADAVWGDGLPGSGAKALSFHVSRLRAALAAGLPRDAPGTTDPDAVAHIQTVPSGGYVLRVDPDAVDSLRFERLVRLAHERLAADPAAARTQLVDALALWRGQPLLDVAYAEFAQPEIRRLEELRLEAIEDRLEADLTLGHHLAVVGELQALVAAEPLRDRLRGQLMLALYRSGRQAEALRVAGEGRRRLSEELGLDPSPELARLEGWILSQDARLDLSAGQAVNTSTIRPRNPFKGLRAFTEADSIDFFGREALVERLVARLDEVSHDARLLVVVGRSGSGKSSAVRAGLLPAVRAGLVTGSERWRVATMVPGTLPFHELAAALRAAGATVPDDAAERAERDADLGPLLDGAVRDGSSRVLLVIDQLEELYVRVAEERREAFTTALVAALGAATSPLIVVATLRADFFDRPLASPALGDLVRRGVEVVTPLTRGELERAITRPAEGVGVSVERGLVADVARDVEHGAAALPLLEYALTDLFEQGDGRQLTRDGYRAIGGVMESVARRADEAWLALDVEGREVARQVLVRLAVPGVGEQTGRRVLRSELRTLADDPALVDRMLDAFGRQRLITFDRDPVSGEPTVEPAHEAVFTAWPRLAAWLDDLRQDLWMHRRLMDAAAEWTAAGREPGFLAIGGRLETFESWAATGRLRLGRTEEAYLAESGAQRERLTVAETRRTAWERRLQRRSRNVLIGLAGVLAVAAVSGAILSLALLGERQAADSARQGAIEREVQARAREIAMGSIASLGKDGQLSMLLGLQAAAVTADRGYVVEEAYDALHWALQDVQVAFPRDGVPTAARQAPEGLRGVFLLTPDALMRVAAAHVTRDLSALECRTYLHAERCPVVVPPSAASSALSVMTASGAVQVTSLAGSVGTGTKVRISSELPADLAPALAAFTSTSGIAVEWDADHSGDLAAALATEDHLPDIAIVSRPWSIAATGRAGRLIDISSLVDVSGIRADAGEYAIGLGAVAPNGSSPAADGRLYAAPLAASADDLLWYPSDAFGAAGYRPPSSREELLSLISQLRHDGHAPWCLGTDNGAASGRETSAWVEDFVLDGSGVDAYDRWVGGTLLSTSTDVQSAMRWFETLLTTDGAVFNGLPSAALTPESAAAWPMVLDGGPGCWLFRGASTDRLSFPSALRGRLAAVPFPSVAETRSTLVLGRLWSVVVLHDRPEVRQLVTELLGLPMARTMSSDLARAGLVPIRSAPAAADDVMAAQTTRVRAALAAGTFRVRALDLFPPSVAAAFRKGVLDDLVPGRLSLDAILYAIDQAWPGAAP